MSGNLGNKIRALRKSLNLTLEEFGNLVSSTSKSTVYKWENNLTKPSTKNFRRIAELANQTLEEFLNDESVDVTVLEADILINENKNLEEQLSIGNSHLKELHDELNDFLNLKIENKDKNYDTEINSITKAILNLEKELDNISNKINSNVKKITDIQSDLLKSNSTKQLFKEKITSLEALFNSSYPLTINEKEMTAEDKIKALEILKLVFK